MSKKKKKPNPFGGKPKHSVQKPEMTGKVVEPNEKKKKKRGGEDD